MAYGLRLRLEFNDDQDGYYAINLKERDYSGLADVRELTGTPALIEYGDSGADELPIVLGAMASISFYAADGDDWGVLYTADRRKFQLEIRKDNAASGELVFVGWLMPQEYSERLTWQPALSIKAICGLGELKEHDYTDDAGDSYFGRKSYLQILTDLLAKLSLSLPIHTAIDWRDSLMVAGDAFAQSFIDVSIYAGLNCREVLDQILTGSRIMQRSGAWYIESYTALKRATHTRYNYDTAGAVLSAPNAISLKGEINQAEIWTEGTPTLQRWPAYDKLVLEQNYGKKPSFLTNYNLDGLNGWTVPSGVVVSDHTVEDETYQCISGIDASGATTGIYQVVPIKKFATDTKIKFSVQVAPVGWHRSTSTVARGIPLTPLAVAVRVQVVLLNASASPIAWLSKDGWVETVAYIDEADVQSTISGPLNFHNIEIETGYPTDIGVGEDFSIKVLLAKAPYQSFGVPGSNWGAYIGLVYSDVIITEGGDFATGQTFTGLNTDRYLDKKDDLKLLAGTAPENENSPLIWAGGLSYTVDGNNRAAAWIMEGSATEYGFCEMIARMMLALRRRPVTIMQANAVGASIEAIYNELNQPGVDYVFVGGSVDLQTRKIDGNWAELLDYTPDAGTISSGKRIVTSGGEVYRSSGANQTRTFSSSGTPKRINDLDQEPIMSNALRIEVDQADFDASKRIDVGQIVNHTVSQIIENDSLKDYVGNNAGAGAIPDTRTILISGAIMWESGLTFKSTKLVYKIIGDDYQISRQTITLEAAHPTLPRIDVFFVDTSSEIGIMKGIPAEVPVKPEIGANDLEIRIAYIPAGATEPDVDVETVYDEHTEWTASETHDDNITVNFDATTTPVTGVKCIEIKITVPDTVVATPTHYLGEFYQGGIIFYLTRGGKTGLIAALQFASVGVQYGEQHSSGPSATVIGSGQANTAVLMANSFNATCAAYYAANYGGGGFNDWFLGSRDENAELMFRKNLFPNFTGPIWSSSQVTGTNDWKRAYASIFDNSTTSDWDKTRSFKVVPIRKFDDNLAIAGVPVDVVTPSSTVINFDAPTPITMANGIVSFYLKSSGEWLQNTTISIRLYNDTERVGRLVISKSTGMHGFNPSDPEWQLIAVPATLFSMTSLTVNKVMIAPVNSWPNNMTLSIERIRIEHDSNQTPTVTLLPGVYGSASKNLIITVDERGVIKNIEEVDNGIGDIAAALDLING